MKIHSVGSEIFHASRRAGGQLDVKKLIAAFRSFGNEPNNF